MTNYTVRGRFHPIFGFGDGAFDTMQEDIEDKASYVQLGSSSDVFQPTDGAYIVINELPQNGGPSSCVSLSNPVSIIVRVSTAGSVRKTSPYLHWSYPITQVVRATPILPGAITPAEAFAALSALWQKESRGTCVQVSYLSDALTDGTMPGPTIERLVDLTDVAVSAVAPGNGIYWNSATQKWANGAVQMTVNGVQGWLPPGPATIGQQLMMTYKQTGPLDTDYIIGPSESSIGATNFVDLLDVSVPAPIAGAMVNYDPVDGKFKQSAAISHNATGDNKIALTTGGAVAIDGSGAVGIQSLADSIAIAGEVNASVTSATGTASLTALSADVGITAATDLTATALGAVTIESGTDLLIRGTDEVRLETTGVNANIVMTADAEISATADSINLTGANIATFQGDTTTVIGVQGGAATSTTNIRCGGAGELNIIAGQAGVAFIMQANTASILTIEEDNKTAAQYALDISSNPSAIPNVRYVLDVVSGDNSQDVRVGGQAPANSLQFGTTNAEDITVMKDTQAIFSTTTAPDETRVIAPTGTVALTAASNVVVTATGGAASITADAGINLTCPADQVTIDGFDVVIENANVPRFTFENDGTLSSATAAYEALVTAPNDIPNRKFVDDAIAAQALSTLSDVTLTAADPGTQTSFLRWDNATDKWTDSRVRYQIADSTVGATLTTGETIVDSTKFIQVTRPTTDYYYPLTTKAEPGDPLKYPTDIAALSPNTWYQRTGLTSISGASPVVWNETQSAANKILATSVPGPAIDTTSAFFPFPTLGPPYLGFLNVGAAGICYVDMGLNMANFSTGFTAVFAGALISNRSGNTGDPEHLYSIRSTGGLVFALQTSVSATIDTLSITDGTTTIDCTIGINSLPSVSSSAFIITVSSAGQVFVYATQNNLSYASIVTVGSGTLPLLTSASFDRLRLADSAKLSQSGAAEVVVFDKVLTVPQLQATLLALREGLKVDAAPAGGYALRELSIIAPSVNETLEWDGAKFRNVKSAISKLADATITAPAGMQGLYYSPSTSKWINRTRSHPMGELTYGGTDPLPAVPYSLTYTAASTWYEIAPPAALVSNNVAFAGFAGNQWATNGLGRIQWLGPSGLIHHLAFSCCMATSGGTGDDYDFAICQNGTVSPFTALAGSVVRERMISNGSYQVMAFHKVVTLATGDNISMITRASGTGRVLSVVNLNLVSMPDKMY